MQSSYLAQYQAPLIDLGLKMSDGIQQLETKILDIYSHNPQLQQFSDGIKHVQELYTQNLSNLVNSLPSFYEMLNSLEANAYLYATKTQTFFQGDGPGCDYNCGQGIIGDVLLGVGAAVLITIGILYLIDKVPKNKKKEKKDVPTMVRK